MNARQFAFGVVILGLAGGIYLAAQPLKRSAQTSSCQTNLRQIANSMMIYQRDYDEKFPKSDNWMDAMMPYARGFSCNPESVKARFACPTTGSFYAYNSQIAGQSVTQVASSAPWLFEVSQGKGKYNLSNDGSLWPASPIHRTRARRGSNAFFAVYFSPHHRVGLSEAKPDFSPHIQPTATPTPRAKIRRKP